MALHRIYICDRTNLKIIDCFHVEDFDGGDIVRKFLRPYEVIRDNPKLTWSRDRNYLIRNGFK